MNAVSKIHPPFTSAEFYRMAAKGAFGDMRVELRRGMILKMSPQHYPHARLKADIQRALERAVSAASLNWEVLTEATVSFADGFEPMPDIIVLEQTAPPTVFRTIPASAVKLVVEVADTTLDDDMGEKREDYARAGLAEYWVADVRKRVLIRHAQPSGGAYTVEQTIGLDGPLQMLTMPDVAAAISAV